MADPQMLSGLATILSSQPIPAVPMFRTMDPARVASEMELFSRNLFNYLKRLYGAFTATNIITTINQGSSGLGFLKSWTNHWHYYGSNDNVQVTLDNTKDWLPYVMSTVMISATTKSDLINTAGAPTRNEKYTWGAQGRTANRQIDVVTSPGNAYDVTLLTNSSGNLILNFGNISGAHFEYYTFTHIVALAKIDSVASYASVGNGV